MELFIRYDIDEFIDLGAIAAGAYERERYENAMTVSLYMAVWWRQRYDERASVCAACRQHCHFYLAGKQCNCAPLWIDDC